MDIRTAINLVEGRDAPLYHATGPQTALRILHSNELKGWDAPISLTRSRRFAHFWGEVVFVLDQTKLAHNFSFEPYRDGNRRHEAEERVALDRPIRPLDRYLLVVEITRDWYERLAGKPNYEALLDHPKLKIVQPPSDQVPWHK